MEMTATAAALSQATWSSTIWMARLWNQMQQRGESGKVGVHFIIFICVIQSDAASHTTKQDCDA
jgi:hypothetical protein